jgi:hypothetical protein
MSPLMNVKEAADYLRLGVSTLNKLRVVGNGPKYFKMHRRITYTAADLDTYIEKHRTKSTSQRKRAAGDAQ